MGKHTVSHTCGHDQVHILFGPHKERDRKLDWLAGTPCSECWRAKQEQERTAANTAAAEANQQMGLPALTGSDRQIAWAESIRKPICAAFKEAEQKALADINPDLSEAAREEVGDAIVLLVDEVCSKAESRWWIDEGRLLVAGNSGQALYHIGRQIEQRGLTPTATAELATIRERQRQERKATEERHSTLVFALAERFSADDFSLQPTGQLVGTIDGHAVTLDGSTYYAALRIDGELIGDNTAGPLRSRLLDRYAVIQRETHARERKQRSDSLSGLAVVSVAKSKQEIKVTLSDGRVLSGRSSREGWSLVRFNSYGDPIDSEHPEAVRLAREAKSWAKLHGVK
jgi:hypothetical protein